MGNATNIIGAFREMIVAKNLSQTDLQDLIKDGIMAALASPSFINVLRDRRVNRSAQSIAEVCTVSGTSRRLISMAFRAEMPLCGQRCAGSARPG